MAVRAGTLAIIGGVLLMAAGATSSTLMFDAIGDFVTEQFPSIEGAVDVTLKVLSWLAALGGIVIVVGGALMLIGNEGIGRLVVVIAAVMAAVGVVVQLVVLFSQGEGDGSWWVDIALWVALAGIVLAFWARPARYG